MLRLSPLLILILCAFSSYPDVSATPMPTSSTPPPAPITAPPTPANPTPMPMPNLPELCLPQMHQMGIC